MNHIIQARYLWFLLVIGEVFAAPNSDPYSYYYKEQLNKDTFYRIVSRKFSNLKTELQIIQLHFHNNDTLEKVSVVIDSQSQTIEWHLKNPGENTSLKGDLFNTTVTIKGTYKKKRIVKTFSHESNNWGQSFPYFLPIIFNKKEVQMAFSMAMGRKSMPFDMRTMNAIFLGQDRIVINDSSYAAIKVKFAPSGIMGKIFKSEFWYDKNSKMLLRGYMKGPPGMPQRTIELIKIKS